MSTPATPPRTPEHPQTNQSGTPRSHKHTGDGHKLTETRIAIATEMDREMLVCGVDSFQQSYLPFVPTAEDIDGCVELLRDKGLLVTGNNGGLRWKDFPKPPSQLSGTEKAVFSPLKAIADVISEYRSTGDTPGRVEIPHVKYRDCPDANVHSELRGATFKIDGCFELDKASGIVRHGVKLVASNIAVSAEFKKKEEDWVDNRQKLVSAASHIMNDDPR
ncbi:hypothetical protein P691DRAFT_787029, partial [Macrolepiota fuliginosa MF-IS2]